MAHGDTAPVDSFYHLSGADIHGSCCRGTACFVARHRDLELWREAEATSPPFYCLGQCFAAPARFEPNIKPRMVAACSRPVLLERLQNGGAKALGEYLASGGYFSLQKARTMGAEAILNEMDASHLRGRGGAGFPAGRKWRAVNRESEATKYVVANADEGDAGSYIDRYLMQEDPQALIEGMAIAGLATGAKKGIIYLRLEYPEAKAVLEAAINEATESGILEDFKVELFIGNGSYVCGEETSLLNSIEHQKPFVRARPPYPFQAGLFGKPTLVNNVETLATAPWIIKHGGSAYSQLGVGKSRGTKLVSLNSLFKQPGLYEVEFGVSVRHIVENLGGGLTDGELKGVMIGGPLAGVLPASQLDTVFGFEELDAHGASVGHGGVIAIDQRTTIWQLMAHIFEFGAFESCGKCTPCKIGTRNIADFCRKLANGGKCAQADLQWLESEVSTLHDGSLCGHGVGLAIFAKSIFRHFRQEVEQCLE